MIVVDNTVLSNFARVGRFDLLRLATDSLGPHITPAVNTAFRSGAEAGPFVDTDLQWLSIAQFTQAEQARCMELSQELGRGEEERARRGNWEKVLSVLVAKVPDVEPEESDRL